MTLNQCNLIYSFYEIFDESCPISIHKSQRPYVWDVEKVSRLIEDLEEFNNSCIKENLIDLPYYMGTIVFYKNCEEEPKLELIDGQQRMTTLLILDYLANNETSVLREKGQKVKIEFRSSISAKNIHTVKTFLQSEDLPNRLEKLQKVLRDKLVFTVVKVDSEDEAFTYFDTQNNRGKKPTIDVVLKAVHLRGIHDDAYLQKKCAKSWEQIERYVFHNIKVPGNTTSFLYPFIDFILWRSRSWKFNHADFGNDDKLEHMFSRDLLSDRVNRVRFFAASVSANHELEIVNQQWHKNERLVDADFYKQSENLPFQLRQPLMKGHTFFLYIEKYAAIYKRLFGEVSIDEQSMEINRFKQFYKKVYDSQSNYMKQYYILCMMMYYDKFGETRLEHFALALDYFVGADRLSNYYIYAERLRNTNNTFNILDAIHMAYDPEEVLELILKDTETAQKKIGAVNKVIATYLYEVLHFYEARRVQVPHKITPTNTGRDNEISKETLVQELNEIVNKRKGWLQKKIKG